MYIRWKLRTSCVWCVHINWRDKNGEMQEDILETQNRVLGKLCENRTSVLIAEVRTGKRRSARADRQASAHAPKPMVFTPNAHGVGLNYRTEDCEGNTRNRQKPSAPLPVRLFKSYFGVRANEPLVEPVPEREIMFFAQWRWHKIYSFLYMLMILPIILIFAVIILAFVFLPIIQALGFEDFDAFFDHLRNTGG